MLKDLGIGHPATHSLPLQQPVNVNASFFYNQTKVPEAVIPSKVDVIAENLAVKTSAALPAGLKKTPVSRPVRHLGPPPGFNHVPLKQVNEHVSGADLMSENSLTDDYSWLDGYQLPSSTKGSVLNNMSTITSEAMPQYINSSNGLSGTASFPFPGKQVSSLQFQTEKQKGWQNYQAFEHLRLQQEQQLQQQLLNGNQQFTPMSEQYHGKSIWSGRYIV